MDIMVTPSSKNLKTYQLVVREEECSTQLPLVFLRLALGPAHCVQGLISQLSGRSKGDTHVPGHLPSGFLNLLHPVTTSLSMFPLVKLIHLEGFPGSTNGKDHLPMQET